MKMFLVRIFFSFTQIQVNDVSTLQLDDVDLSISPLKAPRLSDSQEEHLRLHCLQKKFT